jgi:hypothetical protein
MLFKHGSDEQQSGQATAGYVEADQPEIDPVHRREIPEPLGQAARADEHFTSGHPVQATGAV